MTDWYSHATSIKEGLAETKSELAALVHREPLVKGFLRGQVQYLELIKHRALNEGNWRAVTGLDMALAEVKRLAEPINKIPKETDDE